MGSSASNESFQLSEDELETLRANFHRLDKNSSGGLDQEEFRQCLGGIGLDAELSSILFNIFDKDGDGEVSLKEFLGTISLMVHGSLEERLGFSFELYDLNGNQVIQTEEVRTMLRAMHKAQVSMCPATTHRLTEEQLEQQSQAFFDALDTDKDGQISREEYVAGAMRHPELFRSLGYSAPVETPRPAQTEEVWEQLRPDRVWDNMIDAASDLFTPRQATMGEKIYIGHPALNVVLMVMSAVCTVLQPSLDAAEKPVLIDTEQCLQDKVVSAPGMALDPTAAPPEDPASPSGGSRRGSWQQERAPLDPLTFSEELEWKLPGMNNQEVRVIEHGPQVFQRIRSLLRVDVRQLLEALGIQQLLGNLLMGDCTTLRAGLSEAKSGSFFFESHDSRYVLKTVGDDEFDMLYANLGSYYGHLGIWRLAPPRSSLISLVCMIYGPRVWTTMSL